MTDLLETESAPRTSRGHGSRTLTTFATLALLVSGTVAVDAPAASANAAHPLSAGNPAQATLLDPKINTITGTVFQDINGNGTLNLNSAETGVKDQLVTLYRSQADAIAGTAPVASTTTNSLGLFAFKSLPQGDYVLSFSGSGDYRPSPSEASAVDANGLAIPSIVPVQVRSGQLIFTQNLPLKRVTNLSITPFNDANWNGSQDSGETVIDNKTMIVIDLGKFATAVKDGRLGEINAAGLVTASLTNGNVDLLDGVSLRTTKNGSAIQLPEVDPAVRLIVRSPIDLTLTDVASNVGRIEALVTLLQGGDITALLNDPSVFATEGFDTNNDTYAQQLSGVFAQLANKVDGLDIPAALGSTGSNLSAQTSSQLRVIATLLDAIPAYRLGIVTYFGNSYDLTGLKFNKTTNFPFGIKSPGSIKGSVFLDLDANGAQGSLEVSGASATVTIYDEAGQVLGTASTSALSPKYEIKNVPFDVPLYVCIETANPASPTLNSVDVPAALAGRTIVGQHTISKTATQSSVTQNVAVRASKPTSVSVVLSTVNTTTGEVTLTLSNTDRLSSPVVTLQLNNGATQTITLPKAPLLGSPKKVSAAFSGIAPAGENFVQSSWVSGVYKISLADITF